MFFFGKDDEFGVFTINQGILIPRANFYKFQSCGDEPIVWLRVSVEKEKLPVNRIGVDAN